MSIKNIIDKFFFLDEEAENQEEQQQEKQVAPSRPEQAQQVPQQQQQIAMHNRAKKERKGQVQQMPQRVDNQATPNNVVSLQTATSLKNSKVILIEPRVYAEAQDIAEHLKNKRATIVNLQRIDRDQGTRIIDFLSGTVYALGGDIQRVGNDIFLCTPENVEVSGEISNYVFE